MINPTRVVPQGPDIDFSEPHNRGALQWNWRPYDNASKGLQLRTTLELDCPESLANRYFRT
jgi:hypothetical protein